MWLVPLTNLSYTALDIVTRHLDVKESDKEPRVSPAERGQCIPLMSEDRRKGSEGYPQ